MFMHWAVSVEENWRSKEVD